MEVGGPGVPGASAVLLVVEAPGQRQENAMILLPHLMEPTVKDFPTKNQNVTHKNVLLMEIGGPGAPGAIAVLLVVEVLRQRQENAIILLRNLMEQTAKDFPTKNQNVTHKYVLLMEIGGPGVPGVIAVLLVVEVHGQRQENAMILLRNSMVPTAKGFPMRNQNAMQKNVPLMEIGEPGVPGVSAVLLVVEAFRQRQENAMILLRNSMVPTALDLTRENQGVTLKNVQVYFIANEIYVLSHYYCDSSDLII